MKIREIILSIFSATGLVFSSIFYVLFKESKENQLKRDKKDAEKSAQTNQKYTDAKEDAEKSVIREKEKNAEKIEIAHSGNKLHNFNSGIELLQK